MFLINCFSCINDIILWHFWPIGFTLYFFVTPSIFFFTYEIKVFHVLWQSTNYTVLACCVVLCFLHTKFLLQTCYFHVVILKFLLKSERTISLHFILVAYIIHISKHSNFFTLYFKFSLYTFMQFAYYFLARALVVFTLLSGNDRIKTFNKSCQLVACQRLWNKR